MQIKFFNIQAFFIKHGDFTVFRLLMTNYLKQCRTRKLTAEGQKLVSEGCDLVISPNCHFWSGRAGNQLSTFDAEPKSAKISNSLYSEGVGGRLGPNFQILMLSPNLLKSQIPFTVGGGGRRGRAGTQLSKVNFKLSNLYKSQAEISISWGGEGWRLHWCTMECLEFGAATVCIWGELTNFDKNICNFRSAFASQ